MQSNTVNMDTEGTINNVHTLGVSSLRVVNHSARFGSKIQYSIPFIGEKYQKIHNKALE